MVVVMVKFMTFYDKFMIKLLPPWHSTTAVLLKIIVPVQKNSIASFWKLGTLIPNFPYAFPNVSGNFDFMFLHHVAFKYRHFDSTLERVLKGPYQREADLIIELVHELKFEVRSGVIKNSKNSKLKGNFILLGKAIETDEIVWYRHIAKTTAK